MEWWLIFAVFLYLLSALLIVAEVFIPSAGIISIISLVCLVGGGAIFFSHSVITGWAGVVIALIMIPSVWIVSYKVFPHTKFGKTVTLEPPKREMGDGVPDSPRLKELTGAEGKVLSALRPVGMCEISGRRLECVAETGYIEKDKTVKVIRVQGTQVTVTAVNEQKA